MNAATLIPFAIKWSIILIVVGLGLKATFADATWLFRQPGLLVRSLLGLNVILPLFAMALAVLFDLHPAVKIALVLIAMSPVPPILPKKQLKVGSHQSYVYGLMVAAAVLSVVLIPLSVALVGALSGRDGLYVAPAVVLQKILQTIIVPLAVGMLVRSIVPKVAARLAPVVSLLGTVLLLIGVVPVLVKAWPAIMSLVGNGSVAAIIVLVVAALFLGHLLGGPDEDHKTALALAGAARHPGVAMAVAQATVPDERLVPAAIFLYLLVSAVITLPYVNVHKRRHAAAGAPRPVGH
jgi:bile acid:Na+ symporter, BASS family